jgi:hypothetical protein
MTADQAARLIEETLEVVAHRCRTLQQGARLPERDALEQEFREWVDPPGSHIDLMICPGTQPG